MDEEILPPKGRRLEEAAAEYRVDAPALRVVAGGGASGREGKTRSGKMKTSVYLEPSDVRHLAWLAEVEERPQAEIIRDAIRAYRPRLRERTFLFFNSGEGDGRSFADFTEEEVAHLMRDFGADSFSDPDR